MKLIIMTERSHKNRVWCAVPNTNRNYTQVKTPPAEGSYNSDYKSLEPKQQDLILFTHTHAHTHSRTHKHTHTHTHTHVHTHAHTHTHTRTHTRARTHTHARTHAHTHTHTHTHTFCHC